MAFDRLEAELRSLAADLRIDEPSATVAAVMDRVATEPVPRRVGLLARAADQVRRRWRAAIAAIAGILLIVVAVPPVRAAVTDWLSFGGVVVRHSPVPGPATAPPPPAASGRLSVADARRMVAFESVLPAALGTPSGAEVSADRRVLSFSWDNIPGGRVRLDEFNGELSPMFIKTSFYELEQVHIGSTTGWWTPKPHQVVTVDASGTEHTDEPRVAGQTMLWQKGKVTLRLEGNLTIDRATEIAVTTLGG
jgi:hypothetical protein